MLCLDVSYYSSAGALFMKSLVVALMTAVSVAIVIQAQDRGAAPQAPEPAARLGRLVRARQRRLEHAVDVGHDQPDVDDPVAAHARIPETHGADELPRGRQQRAAVGGLVLLSRGLHALVGAGLGRRQ